MFGGFALVCGFVMRRLHLRVLYTINSSSYILARSPTPVLVTPINPSATQSELYGSVSFKTCLEAICRSSPELVPTGSRDFSVYVLDPLESSAAPAPIDITNSAGGPVVQTRGVAVGMGSMSLSLSTEEQEPVTVVGTFSKTGAGQDALEVIIALREIVQQSTSSSRTVNTRSLHASNPSGTITASETLATIASIRNRVKPKTRPKKPPRVSSTPMTESDKLLDADTYVGPVKKKGRPKGASPNEVKVKTEELSVSTSVSAQNSFKVPSIPKSSTNVESPTAMATTHSVDPHSANFSSLALLFSSTQNETARNASLLNALNLIDSSATQHGSQQFLNTALISALRQLLDNACVKTLSNTSSSPSASQPSILTSSSADNEVIAVDKENIAPTTFRQRAEREQELAKLAGISAPETILSNDLRNTEGHVSQSRGLGARSIENTPPKTQPPNQSTSLPTNGLLRKRTLDDCMEERDSKRSKGHRRGKEKGRTDKKELSRPFLSHQLNLRHYPGPVASTAPRSISGSNSYYRTPIDPWTSPPRPSRQESINSQSSPPSLGGTSRSCPIVIPDSPQAPQISASSPIKPSIPPKRPYTVPSWAHTGTATQPRFSEKARLAAIEAEEKKKEEKRANRRRSNAASARERSRQQGKLVTQEDENPLAPEPPRPQASVRAPLPVEPQTDLPPIVASNDTTLNLFPSPARRPRSPSPVPKSQLPPPVTPKRPSKTMYSTPGMMRADDDSLFTPISIARRSTGAHGSPLFSPGVFGSPLARKSVRVSPTLRRSCSGQFGSESSVSTLRPSEQSDDTIIRPKNSAPEEQEESPDELDCPPSSLPLASSDIETDDKTIENSVEDKNSDTRDDDDDDEYALPRKQHWIGLPPSSPPPPSSPHLMPVGGDDEVDAPYHASESGADEELPVASEEDEAENEQPNEALEVTESDWASGPAGTDLDADDLTVTLRDHSETSTETEQEVMDESSFFKEFTTIGSTDDLSDDLSDLPEAPQGSTSLTTDSIDSLFANNLESMDLKGFWEAFRTATSDGLVPDATEQAAAFDLSMLESSADSNAAHQPVDHKKLAADLQALFSGCLV